MEGIDTRAVEWLSSRDWPVVTPIMRGLTDAGAHGIVWIAIAAAVALWLRRPLVLLAVVAAVEIASYLDGVLKTAIGRERPPLADPRVHALIPLPHDPSMPSGHALMAFAAAVVLGVAAPALRWPLLILATGIGLSRVYLGVHYPSDVLAGAAIGVAVGAGCAWIMGGGERLIASHRRPIAG